jgi:hypothetical protein
MKLTNKQSKTLIAVLNAQSGVTPIDDKEKYNEMKAEVASFLQVKDGKAMISFQFCVKIGRLPKSSLAQIFLF